jgi:hypothetical protein
MRSKAFSPFISTAFIIALGIAAISLVLTVVKPALDKARDSAIINEAFQNLNLIDGTIREVASEGEYSKRTINLKVTDGVYNVDSLNDRVIFTYSLKSDLDIGGSRDRVNVSLNVGNVNLFVSYDKLDIQGSDHFPKGENIVIISHDGTNPTSNYPIIYVGK